MPLASGAFHCSNGRAEPFQSLWRNADAIVFDINVQGAVDLTRADIHAAMFGREFHRVMQQRCDDPFERGADRR